MSREHWRKGWIKGSYFIDRLVARFVTAFIAVSEANGEYLRTEKRLPRREDLRHTKRFFNRTI